MGGLDFDAGKYALFVWPAFAITAVVLAWMVADSLLRARKWRREVARLEAQASQPQAGQ